MENKMKRGFLITFELDGEEVDTGFILIDQKVIDNVDDEFHEMISDKINTPEEIAEFIGYNVFVNNAELTNIDGFANLSNDLIEIVNYPVLDNFDIKAREFETWPGKKNE
jgi:hypothetical protein